LSANPTSEQRVLAIKKYLYEACSWNDFKPYQYDFGDPISTKISNKLLPTYLKTRKGNYVNMPLLFVILGQKLGKSRSWAPNVRYCGHGIDYRVRRLGFRNTSTQAFLDTALITKPFSPIKVKRIK
jgi:hypothetical protein